MDTISLQQIRNEFESERLYDETLTLDKYLKENFTPCYDTELNFIGYERGAIFHQD